MSELELTEKLLAKIGGWEAMQRARSYWREGKVLSADWSPPVLKGSVQAGGTSYRCGLVIQSAIDVENLCRCRDSRDWGTICAHSLAIGVQVIKGDSQPPAAAGGKAAPPANSEPKGPVRNPDKCLSRAAGDEDGEPIEIFLVLPPNFDRAVGADKVMVYLEGRWSGGRQPLNTLPMDVAFGFDERDLALLDAVEELGEGETPGMLMLRAAQLAELLPVLRGRPRMTLGKDRPFQVLEEPFKSPMKATLEENGEIELVAKPDGKHPVPILGDRMWMFEADEFRPFAVPRICAQAIAGPVRVSRAEMPRFLSLDWPELVDGCELEANFNLEDFTIDAEPPRLMLSLTGTLHKLEAALQCCYGTRIFTLGGEARLDELWLPDPDQSTRYSTRDLAAEQAALDRLLSAGFRGPNNKGRLGLTGELPVLTFFARLYQRLEKEWEVHLKGSLEPAVDRLDRIEPEFQFTPSGENWFDLQVTFKSGSGERFSPAEIQRLLLSGRNHSRLKNGRNAVIDTDALDDFQEVLRDCEPEQHGEGYRIDERQAGYLNGTLAQMGFDRVKAPEDWRSRVAGQTGDAAMEPPPLGDLEEVLRPYQKEGVGWLSFLRKNRFGGILADEMGLGKTVQTLAALRAAIQDCEEGERSPSLIVCPTSLVDNWISEAAKFTPELKTLALHGAGRHADFARIPDCDLVVTSYALVRRDLERYGKQEFDTVVLDEAQHIKNRQTQNARAVKAVRARNRLVLTGTPMENSVLDLWSIFDFLMPGYLGSAKDFKERYEVPITKEKDSAVQSRLARRLRPFLLRRLKSEVAKDLPEKLEQVSFCDLTKRQSAAYEQILESGRQKILEADSTQGAGKGRMVALQVLLRLRQVCCDLRLLDLGEVEKGEASGKLDMFQELLEESIDGGHRLLVFSQFVSMLTLLKESLDASETEYCYLDGSTRNRKAVVDRFQSESSIPVFLISLKAGGTGLNLTGADTVVHFDPWWNPAVEDQATDRAHRIGQKRVVTSYKLIARGTVEEKILSLQQRKREITKGMLGDETAFTESLSWEEIKGLFD
jgi:superfamily II DNA or RNA helicase